MLCDSTGVLWVAQMPGDVYRYDRNSDCFVKEFDFTDPGIKIYNFTFLSDGSILACTNKGIYLLRKDMQPENLALDDILVTSIEPAAKGGYYAGTEAGVYYMEPSDGFQTHLLRGTRNMYVKSLAEASGKLFVGTFSGGAYIVDPNDTRVEPKSVDIPSLPVNCLTKSGEDSLLLGVDGAGVYLIDCQSGNAMRHYTDEESAGPFLSGNTVTDVHVDRNKGL